MVLSQLLSGLAVLVLSSDVQKYSTGDFALGIKTCRFYHDTRLKALMTSWGRRVPLNRTVFGTDGALAEYSKNAIVVKDLPRNEPYRPPWAQEFNGSEDDIDPFSLPRLTVRLYALLRELHKRHADGAAPGAVHWFLVVDDDTFVRVRALQHYLSLLDHRKPLIIGGIVPSDKFVTRDREGLGPSLHCGGGSGFALSRTALERVLPHLTECLAARYTTLWWYWDEVELGRCLYHHLHINCTCPRCVWGLSGLLQRTAHLTSAPAFGALEVDAAPVAATDPGSDLDLMRELADFEFSSGRFLGGLSKASDWLRYEGYVDRVLGGNMSRVGALTFHTALPQRMAALGAVFSDAVDRDWVRRFDGGADP